MAVNPSSTSRITLFALVAGAAGAALAGCGTDSSATGSDDPSAEVSSSTAASETSKAASTPAPESSAATKTPVSDTPSQEPADPNDAATAPVYYVGETPHGQRLYREFQVVGSADVGAASLDALANGVPTDPDYSSLVPNGDVVAVEKGPGRIRIVLPEDSDWTEPGSLSAEQAKLAAQSVVYTVQGALGERRPVQVILKGSAKPTTLFGIDTAGGLAAAPELDVLAQVNITSPAEGQSVPAQTITAQGRASSFEATVPWEVRDRSDKVVTKGSATAEGWMGRLYPWTVQVDLSTLKPGTYTFIARTDDPSGGAEGPGAFEDTKTITVR